MTTPIQWQEQIARVCTHIGVQQVDLLLDQAGWGNRAVPALEILTPKVPWFSLFTGTPEQNLTHERTLFIVATIYSMYLRVSDSSLAGIIGTL